MGTTLHRHIYHQGITTVKLLLYPPSRMDGWVEGTQNYYHRVHLEVEKWLVLINLRVNVHLTKAPTRLISDLYGGV